MSPKTYTQTQILLLVGFKNCMFYNTDYEKVKKRENSEEKNDRLVWKPTRYSIGSYKIRQEIYQREENQTNKI